MNYTKGNITKKSLLETGVTKLKRFGFVHVTVDNIMLDEVYKYLFKKILMDEELRNIGQQDVVDKLLKEISDTIPKAKKKSS